MFPELRPAYGPQKLSYKIYEKNSTKSAETSQDYETTRHYKGCIRLSLEVFRRNNTIPCPELRRNRITVFSRVFDNLFLRTRTYLVHTRITGKPHGSESPRELIKGRGFDVVSRPARSECDRRENPRVYRCVHEYRAFDGAFVR